MPSSTAENCQKPGILILDRRRDSREATKKLTITENLAEEKSFKDCSPPSPDQFLVRNRYLVERKTTQQIMDNPLDKDLYNRINGKLNESTSSSSEGSEQSRNQKSRKNIDFKRSLSHEPMKPRVNFEDDFIIENQQKTTNFSRKNHFTVTGATDNADRYRNNSATIAKHGRFHVYRSDNHFFNQNCSSPGAFGKSVVPTPRKFDKSFYWLAMHSKNIGFRYIFLCLLVIFYTLFGALMFYLIEGTNEKKILEVRQQNLDILLDHLAGVLSNTVNDPNKTVSIKSMKTYIKDFYIALQKEEAQYKWSTYYRLEDPENNLKWTFSSAFFFSMNVYTTTGYGAIAAETIIGQLFTMFYAFCFVPMTLVILRDLGQMFLVNFTKLYAHALTFFRKLKGNQELDDDELIQLPIKWCLTILIIYLLFCTTFVYMYDAAMGPEWDDGLSYFTAFYFSFISLTTIGLGDVMPNNVPFTPGISILFFIGMAVTKVVNRATYISIENGVFGLMTLIETKIDNWLNRDRQVEVVAEQVGVDKNLDYENDAIKCRNAEMLNNFTVRSIATFMQSNQDIYGGGFGRVTLRRGDLLHRNHP